MSLLTLCAKEKVLFCRTVLFLSFLHLDSFFLNNCFAFDSLRAPGTFFFNYVPLKDLSRPSSNAAPLSLQL